MKVLHLSTYTNGGAGRAAVSLDRAMRENGIESSLKQASGPTFRASRRLERGVRSLERARWTTWRSVGLFGSERARRINACDADIVNLHWVTDGFLSVSEIARITKPIVWTMHDMWTFTGTEHYGDVDSTKRWETGYSEGTRDSDDRGLDLERWTWNRKMRIWRHPAHLVAVSSWLASAAQTSELVQSWPMTVIPNVMNVDTFRPHSSSQARQELRLPDGPIITFISSAGISDQRKGWHLLIQAMRIVVEHYPDVKVVVVGQSHPNDEAGGTPGVVWFGHVANNSRMAQLLSASDVVAVPSTLDNLPMTACEGQTAGTPVVAFRVGGLVDTVDHQKTGYLASPFDISDFARGIVMAIEDSRGPGNWGRAARARATELWSPKAVVAQYRRLYEEVLG